MADFKNWNAYVYRLGLGGFIYFLIFVSAGYRFLFLKEYCLFGRCYGNSASRLESTSPLISENLFLRSRTGTTGFEPAISRLTILHVNQATLRPHNLSSIFNAKKYPDLSDREHVRHVIDLFFSTKEGQQPDLHHKP